MEDKQYAHIQLGVNFADLIRTTLGPRGMNKVVVSDAGRHIHTNDGASIVKNLKSDDPIIMLFKELAESQEEKVGDGTTTSIVLAGQLLSNALNMINKGIHPTIIINGYTLAKIEAMKFLDSIKEEGDKEKIIQTAFGSKISQDMVNHLKKLILSVKDYEKLRIHKRIDDPNKSELFEGYVFDGFTINDLMKDKIKGKIAVLDYRTNVEAANLQISSKEELEKINQYDRSYKKEIIDKLAEKKIDCLFYTDTNPEFESQLTERGITGVVIHKREHIDGICEALKIIPSSRLDKIHIGKGEVEYVKPNQIYVNGETETLILCGSTRQTLDEVERSVHDVVSLLKHDIHTVLGAGCVEIEVAAHLTRLAKQVGGKEQIAVEKFAEALESIPLIIAENAGLDAIEVLTNLKTQHSNNNKDLGVEERDC